MAIGALIAIAMREARARHAPAAVLTFEPHPRKFFAPEKPLFRLTPEPAKLAVFRKLGLDGAFVRRFDAGLAGTSAAAFVERLLGQELGASGVVVGHDFHFGKGRQGTPALLEALCREKGWACVIVPPVTSGGASISSGAVRAALERGEIAAANALLGHRWFVQGEVRHGEKRGRTLGFPTANIRLSDECGLRHGIYAVRAAVAAGRSTAASRASAAARPSTMARRCSRCTCSTSPATSTAAAWTSSSSAGSAARSASTRAEALVGRMNEDARLARTDAGRRFAGRGAVADRAESPALFFGTPLLERVP